MYSEQDDFMTLLLFFQNKESRLKILHTFQQQKKEVSGCSEDILATDERNSRLRQ
jgi:hypothetical protein